MTFSPGSRRRADRRDAPAAGSRSVLLRRALLLSLLLAPACAFGERSSPFAGAAGMGPAWVEVQNLDWSDVVVRVRRPEGLPVRLGLVTTSATLVFRLPSSALGSGRVVVEADPVGGGRIWLSEPYPVSAGDTIRVTLQGGPRDYGP